jgi:FkbM family methyltransferase
MTFVSFAQNYEDVMLWRALKHVPVGFYVDVGANDPEQDSVTRAFYERGWSGINIEPVSAYHDRLRRIRPRDVNLQLVAGTTETERTLYEIPGTGLSTLDATVAERHRASGREVRCVNVRERPLRSILAEYATGDIHFLKIDVEGAEEAVLRGCSLRAQRPWIIVVEATVPMTQIAHHGVWEPLLAEEGYAFVYFDGLNRFYVAAERSELRESFNSPPNFFDEFIRASEAAARLEVEELRRNSPPVPEAAQLARRVARIEETLSGISSAVANMAQTFKGAVQDLLGSRVAYLGDHRALTYLRSGQKLYVDTRSVDIGSHLLLDGLWEANYVKAFCGLLKPGDVVLDVGANHGVYALLAAQRIGPHGRVHAFEPARNLFQLICASVSVNGLDKIVAVERLAVADAARETTLVSHPRWSGGAHLAAASEIAPRRQRFGEEESEVVNCVALDEHFGNTLTKIDAVKMDIEGAEGLALKGMTKLIDRSPHVKIMMEFCPAMLARYACDATFVIGFFRTRAFMCWTIAPDGGLVPARWDQLLDQPDLIQNVIVSRYGLP